MINTDTCGDGNGGRIEDFRTCKLKQVLNVNCHDLVSHHSHNTKLYISVTAFEIDPLELTYRTEHFDSALNDLLFYDIFNVELEVIP